MLRKKLSRSAPRAESPSPQGAFTKAYWTAYIDGLANLRTHEFNDLTPPNTEKYGHNSLTVQKVKDLFGPEMIQPSHHQIVALLKSPFSQGDISKAYTFIRFCQLSDLGYFITNDGFDRAGGAITLQGAENWNHVMCYMNSLLFSMFANLESFEPILFLLNQHPNPLVAQLLCLLRIYVNLLRLGSLITTDITQQICYCLYKLGFAEALSHRQQDCAPLFEFLTETLAMPLLTFRVEIQHSGKHDADDNRFSKERILFVSIPEEAKDSEDDTILLEECLEHYFKNSVSVMRELERRATLEEFKNNAPSTPTKTSSAGPTHDATSSNNDASQSPQLANRPRSASRLTPTAAPLQSAARARSSTLSMWSISSLESKPREVLLPAWMLLRLMPFYTDDNDVTSANKSVARNTKEFANRRPVLPICLKRYSYSASAHHGDRSCKTIIVPPFIDLPLFVADDDTNNDSETGFRLILESAVCHRGTSIESGHFVSAVRKNTHFERETFDEALSSPWYLYDDLKKTKVVDSTFKNIFDTEWPYMLFYRLVAIDKHLSSSAKLYTLSADDSSLVIAPTGHNLKYWKDDCLTPIYSSEDDPLAMLKASTRSTLATEEYLDIKRLKSVTGEVSPNIIPRDAGVDGRVMMDIRNRYLWYVTDNDKNYYRECATRLRTGSKNMSIIYTPQFRRNSQWSEGSNISNLSMGGLRTTPGPGQFSPEEVGQKLEQLAVSAGNLEPRSSEGGLLKIASPNPDGSATPKDELHLKKPASWGKRHVRMKRADYKREKCVVM